MTAPRAPKYSYPAQPGRPADRAVAAGLVLAVIAGLAWIGGMIYTIAGWSG
ncbi:morphogenic membrane protein MmpA [Streptomyces sp. NPDC005930]|uniref:morphogenic membrane protein MmpA n=1 Tax=Streptomyces sp. NPDC005930 TaxID=3364736 RepID=UPI0036989B7A